jgi:hypothetical protein
MGRIYWRFDSYANLISVLALSYHVRSILRLSCYNFVAFLHVTLPVCLTQFPFYLYAYVYS